MLTTALILTAVFVLAISVSSINTNAGGQPAGKSTPAFSPDSAECEAHIRQLQQAHGDLVKVETVETTAQGRPIIAVTVTDPTVSDDDKQNVLITGGQHGNEESGRMLALVTLDWLVTDAAAETRRKQKIVVFPNVNPDGCDLDIHATPCGIQPNLDHPLNGEPKTPEGRAVDKISNQLQPELYLDLHSKGGSGCNFDMVLYPRLYKYQEDDNIAHDIAGAMCAAGEQGGLPQITHTLTWWGSEFDDSSTTIYHYHKFKSIVMLTENSEHNDMSYDMDVRMSSGLAKVIALLEYGNKRYPHFYHEGYPCGMIGMMNTAFIPYGKTAAERRASRVEYWQNRETCTGVKVGIPEPLKEKTYRFKYDGPTLTNGIAVQTRSGLLMKIKKVTLDGKDITAAGPDVYYTWQDNCSTYVTILFPTLEKGEHVINVDFE